MRRISALAALAVAGVSVSLGCETKATPAPPVASSEAASSAAA